MNASEDDTDAQLDRLTESLTTLVVTANDALRAVWAIRRDREAHRLLVHDGSGMPDDVPPLACTDDPPSREAL